MSSTKSRKHLKPDASGGPATTPGAARANWAELQAATPALQAVGLVTGQDGSDWLLRSGAAQVRARRAASCLLRPAVGDTVSLCLVAPDEAWVTAILEREAVDADVLASDRPLQIEAAELTLRADQIRLQSQSLEAATDSARLVGREVNLYGTVVKLVGQTLSSVFDRVTHFAKHHLRHTEAIDRVQAQHVEIEAGQMVRVSSEHTLLNGDKLIKARGGQIHFG